jgi:hypothetical protein
MLLVDAGMDNFKIRSATVFELYWFSSCTARLLAHGSIDPRRVLLLVCDTEVQVVESLLYWAVACY